MTSKAVKSSKKRPFQIQEIVEVLPKPKRKRIRKTFWTILESGEYKIIHDKFEEWCSSENEEYKLQYHKNQKIDGTETFCWKLVSGKNNTPRLSIWSADVYRFAYIWKLVEEYGEDFSKIEEYKQKVNRKGDSMMHHRHLCGQNWCCNPEHVQLGTRLENEEDKYFHYFLHHESFSVCQKKKFKILFKDHLINKGLF